MRYIILLLTISLFSFAPKIDTIDISKYAMADNAYQNMPFELSLEQLELMKPQETLLAFPNAEGFGKYAVGGSGGAVVHVINLNDSGTGSLREAMLTPGARTIVFDVGGIINLLSPIVVGSTSITLNQSLEHMTVAGETAPFPGITIQGNELYFHSGEVILRFLTIRSADFNGATNADSPNCIKHRNWGTSGYIMENIIHDHLTLSHAGNENWGVYADQEITAPIRNISLTNSMIGNLDGGDGNILIAQGTQRLSLYKNYLHHTDRRNPIINNGRFQPEQKVEYINNVNYMGVNALGSSYGFYLDVIANTFTSATGYPTQYDVYGVGNIGYQSGAGSTINDSSFFFDGNIIQAIYGTGAGDYSSEIINYNRTSRAINDSYITSWVTGRDNIANAVLPTVGNYIFRETIDQQMIDEYYTKTGSYAVPTKPTKSSTTRPASDDSDSDDMLDVAEIALWGDITTTNTPLGTTATSVLDNSGNSINGYDNIRKTHFYLAGDLGGVAPIPTPTVLSPNSQMNNQRKSF